MTNASRRIEMTRIPMTPVGIVHDQPGGRLVLIETAAIDSRVQLTCGPHAGEYGIVDDLMFWPRSSVPAVVVKLEGRTHNRDKIVTVAAHLRRVPAAAQVRQEAEA